MGVLIPRSEWGSTYDYAARHAARPANPKKVESVLHTSVTIAPDLVPPYSDEYAAMRTLERIGVQRFGSGVSYNAAVMPSGRAYQGMPLNTKSTHSEYSDWNFTRASIVLVGDHSKHPPTEAALKTVARIQAEWKKQGFIDKTDLRWHAQVAPKACPGSYAIKRIPDINTWTRKLLVVTDPLVSLKRIRLAATARPLSYVAGTRLVQKALKAEGLLGGAVPGRFGSATKTAYAAWQRRIGYKGSDANGVPGAVSLKKLGGRHGFGVKP